MKNSDITIIDTLKEKFGDDVILIDKEGSINFSCDGCRDKSSKCCTNRGDIIINPYDTYKIQKKLDMKYIDIISKYGNVQLGEESKIPLVTLKEIELQSGERICSFLKVMDIDGERKRGCKIQDSKPSVCELFPLGRIHSGENNSVLYILQSINCGAHVDNQIKIRDWAPNIEESEKAFIYFQKHLNNLLKIIDFKKLDEEKEIKEYIKIDLYKTYIGVLFDIDHEKDFFEQFEKNSKEVLKLIKEFTMILLNVDIDVTPDKK